MEGRFCTSCGHPLTAEPTVAIPLDEAGDWRTGTAERPAVDDGTAPQAAVRARSSRPSSPPPPAPPSQPAAAPTGVPGDGPRFPLFADETAAQGAPPGQDHHAAYHVGTTTTRTPAPEQLAPTPVEDRGRRRWLMWGVVGAALVLIVLFAVWLVTGPFGSSAHPNADHASASGPGAGASSSGDNLARGATATVPATAPPSQDTSGNMVRYDARQMLDGVPTTCWRMPGDGTGRDLTFDLGQQSRITSVGLINGYAKTAREGGRALDWYYGNRRILSVEWSFDDGTTVTQKLGETRQMQTVDLDHPVTTSSVHLRLVEVSAPGRGPVGGPAARDYTAISDVTLRGSAS